MLIKSPASNAWSWDTIFKTVDFLNLKSFPFFIVNGSTMISCEGRPVLTYVRKWRLLLVLNLNKQLMKIKRLNFKKIYQKNLISSIK